MAETIETWLANSSTGNTPGAIKNLVPMGTHQPDFNIFDDFNVANSSTGNTPGAIKNLVPMGTYQPDFNIFDDFNVAKCHLGEVNLESLRPAVFPANLQA